MRIRRLSGIWWLSPAGALSLSALPTLFLAVRTSDMDYRIAWGTPKALTSQTVALAVCGLLAFVLAASLFMMLPQGASTPKSWPNLSPAQNRVLEAAAGPLFWLTVLGYAAFLLTGLRNGLRLGSLLQSVAERDVYSANIKGVVGTIPGVTTLTQVGIAFVVVSMLVLVQYPNGRLRRRLALVMLLAVLRSILVTERLAILELAVPAVAVLTFHQMALRRRSARRYCAIMLAPLIFIPLLLTVFGAFEYSRSWVYFSTRTSHSYSQFVVQRFAGYYATAYNNGQLTLSYEGYPGRVPYESVEAVWTAPVIARLLPYPGPSPSVARATNLRLHGNPEYNSPCGLLTPYLDWGTGGGFAYLAIIGGLLGFLYRRCVGGRVFAVVLYPAMTTGLFELPRYIYWTLGRFMPALVALCLVGWLSGREGPAPVRTAERTAVAAGA
jgi:hypothetical protein